MSIFNLGRSAGENDSGTISDYTRFYSEDTACKTNERNESYTTVINHYYDVVTDFYEYGWGDSFHFAPRAKKETFLESLRRHEYFLAHKMNISKGDKVLDLGCGIGGPMRAISRFTKASVVGVNNNEYQIKRGSLLNIEAGLDELCSFVKGDFHHLPVEDESFDAVYTIEASCHSPNRVALYSEMLRVLKPGGIFGGYEWTMTDRFDPDNKAHQRIKHDILEGDGLPDIGGYATVKDALVAAGFEIIEIEDVASEGDIPWYNPLSSGWSLNGFKHTVLGRALTTVMLYILESIGLAPKGAYATQQMLCRGADGLVKGGELKIFTPMYFFIAKKPE